ncbi:hypothetical protein SARC_07932 [Sphaeroforma arctica JP610]|uniref:Uncharacterized protein n=1 Tax=Sphaeroforma arctica JP610 TaxID=667725 RepID=A0A0L0FSG7_9EUKA|nr:hypothetical protein SARC_07932 [Sphaeroforma arctica JP610]KNC79685.1 hypothetical protein SARC_07932 [Sphaeroforma arctica JP610]|eukprot:XP_014153587.1 hypothetical protein SARC_07932 [Sphaeroforma arctica JP610]
MSKAYREALMEKARLAAKDYAEAFKIVGRYCKNKPIRALAMAGTAYGAYYISNEAPDRRHYVSSVTKCQDEIILMPPTQRKQSAIEYIQQNQASLYMFLHML